MMKLLRSSVILVFVVTIAAPLACRGDDAGPATDVAAIRHDLPILWAAGIPPDTSGEVAHRREVSAVVVHGDGAVAEWASPKGPGIVVLRKIYGRWTAGSEFLVDARGAATYWNSDAASFPVDSNGVTSSLLSNEVRDPALLDFAMKHLPLVQATNVHSGTDAVVTSGHGDGWMHPPQLGYRIDLASGLRFEGAKVPDSPMTIANFDLTVITTTGVPATGIAVAPPFVLSPKESYVAEILDSDGSRLANIPARLQNNTLYFTLQTVHEGVTKQTCRIVQTTTDVTSYFFSLRVIATVE